MTNRTERGPDAHAGHDALLIAQFAAGDVDPRERAAAEQLVDSCSACAQVATDLRLIARATAQLPEPSRPRDFTLSREQADRLRGRGFLGRLGLGWIRTDFGRTLAAGLTTLGLAGLLIGVVPGQLMMGSSAAAPLQTVGKSVDGANGAGSEAGQPAASSGGSVAGPQASAAPASAGPPAPAATGQYGTRDITGGEPIPSKADTLAAAPSPTTDDRSRLYSGTEGGQGPNYLISASVAVLALGLGLFALRRLTSPSV